MSDDWQVRGVSNAELNRDAERSARWDRERRQLKAEVERLREQLEATEAWGNDGWAWLDDALKALGVDTVFDIPAALHPDEKETR